MQSLMIVRSSNPNIDDSQTILAISHLLPFGEVIELRPGMIEHHQGDVIDRTEMAFLIRYGLIGRKP